MASSSLLLALALSPVLLSVPRCAGAVEYTVGGDGANSWDTGTNFAVWADQYRFTVGDFLVFRYVKSQHNVYEVTENAYKTCDAAAGVLNRHSTGYDRIELKEAKNYWYLCSFPGHCLGGMKLAVNVSAAATAGGGGPTPGAPVRRERSAASPAGDRQSWWVLGMAFGAVGLVNWGRYCW